MVQIIIPPLSSPQKLIMLELQGSIETEGPDLQDTDLGDLEFDKKGTPYLTIGHHRLEGQLVKLDKPFAVVRKRDSSPVDPCPSPPQSTYAMDIDSDALLPSSPPLASSQLAREHDAMNQRMVIYDVVTVLREKFVFKQRPELMVAEELRGMVRM
ncbi:chromosome transmission fidelity protein 8 [Endogone sp. FLAS-F59071]|nr:chromosome transmission fidelity protein 8 [Endogone sp. FLAS-F59071]|eukprot:RUS18169.1 chromosome transmission fidelity protein 8 [Endogone sp. FLAS-F59071]